jgi:hypothetical protein
VLSRWQLGLCALLLLLGAALAWQLQAWRYGRLLAQQEQQLVQQRLDQAEALHGLLLAEREQRQGWSNACTRVNRDISRSLPMRNRLRLACVTALPLPICACRSWSSAAPAVAQCLPPPPAAWIMAPYAPDLTQRMLDELSPSPTAATAD